MSDDRALQALLQPVLRLDFDAYVEQIDTLEPERLKTALIQAHIAIQKLTADLLARPPAPADEDFLAGLVDGRHGRMVPPRLAPALRLLVREVVAPGTGLDRGTATATLLYPVVLAAVGREHDERRAAARPGR